MKRKLSVVILLALLLSLLVLPARAAQLNYVTDEAGLLSEQERAELEDLCSTVSALYPSAVYIVTVDDFRDYGSGDVFEVTYGIYHEYQLGKGAGRDGVILLLSMEDRDFALFVYGDQAEYALDSYGQLQLEEAFLPYFREDDWYGGFRAYAETAEYMIERAQNGDPVRESPAGSIGVAIVLSFVASLIICLILRSGMKNVYTETDATVYLSKPLHLIYRRDQFIRKTESRRKIESSSSSGSSRARVGGGGSGRSGKF